MLNKTVNQRARAGLGATTHRHLSSSGQKTSATDLCKPNCCYATSRLVAMRKKPIAYSQKAGRMDGTMHDLPRVQTPAGGLLALSPLVLVEPFDEPTRFDLPLNLVRDESFRIG